MHCHDIRRVGPHDVAVENFKKIGKMLPGDIFDFPPSWERHSTHDANGPFNKFNSFASDETLVSHLVWHIIKHDVIGQFTGLEYFLHFFT